MSNDRFGEFLIDRGLLERDQVLNALEIQADSTVKIGTICLEEGFMTMKQVMGTLRKRADSNKPFEDLAIQLEYLTSQQLANALKIQGQRRPFFGELLVKLELIDIWHFGLSTLLVEQGTKTTDELAQEIAACFDVEASDDTFLETVEAFACDCLATRGFSTTRFAQVIQRAEMSLDELYRGYVGKNVLNFFRQDHGYKDGSYIKVWNGREDNEHLVDLVQELNSQSASFKDDLYAGLKDRYTALNA